MFAGWRTTIKVMNPFTPVRLESVFWLQLHDYVQYRVPRTTPISPRPSNNKAFYLVVIRNSLLRSKQTLLQTEKTRV
uniref:Uncharacterized protein n=1 Tax=Anguilla anguilla TaxID=7936 RepID=A0A0E9WR08_ANGAN